MSPLGDGAEQMGKGLGTLLGIGLVVWGVVWLGGKVLGFLGDVLVVLLWVGGVAIGVGVIGFGGWWGYQQYLRLYGPLRCKNCRTKWASPHSDCPNCGTPMRGFKFQCASCGTIWSSYHADCPDCGALMEEP